MNEEPFYVVGIGCSAGGLDALQQFFSKVRKNSDAGYVIIPHLKRDYKSQLDVILGRTTDLPVSRIKDGEIIQSNKVYVLPENMKAYIEDKRFRLKERSALEIINETINYFFNSLAENIKDHSIGIVMSGTGTDGTKGLYEIEKYNGITIVQNPETAKFDGMPKHSIQFDHPSYILSPEEMAEIIFKIASGHETIEHRGQRRLSDFK